MKNQMTCKRRKSSCLWVNPSSRCHPAQPSIFQDRHTDGKLSSKTKKGPKKEDDIAGKKLKILLHSQRCSMNKDHGTTAGLQTSRANGTHLVRSMGGSGKNASSRKSTFIFSEYYEKELDNPSDNKKANQTMTF